MDNFNKRMDWFGHALKWVIRLAYVYNAAFALINIATGHWVVGAIQIACVVWAARMVRSVIEDLRPNPSI